MRIVGIGASAGGLEAFDQLFRHLPPSPGVAFVLVPHLDPSHASILTDILQRSTPMRVVEAADGITVAANRVYVIPPNRDMIIHHGHLVVTPPERPRGQRTQIDAFLSSLAADQGVRAVGIILSGTGQDGTKGLGDIMKAGGMTFVQEPSTAKYDGMPHSAIEAGHAAFVLPVQQIAAALVEETLPTASERPAFGPSPPSEISAAALAELLTLLRSTTGHDFTQYKKNTIHRRIERRMRLHDLTDIQEYIAYLRDHPVEVHALYKECLIKVTGFFRDPKAFTTLAQLHITPLISTLADGAAFRVWVSGCATGEEAYSIAILVSEAMQAAGREVRVQIYSTDLDDDAIAFARAGTYPLGIAEDVTAERLQRYFVRREHAYRIRKEIRDMVVFAVHSVIKDPPFTRLDLLSCRNVMIYIEPDQQSRLIRAFHYALKPGGVLFLSTSEGIGHHTDLFAPLDRKWKLYRAEHVATATRQGLAGGLYWTAQAGKAQEQAMRPIKDVNYAELSRRALLRSFAPASVLSDSSGNILYVYGETGKFLRPAPGQASLNVIDMAREGLQTDLRAAVQAAVGEGLATMRRDVSVRTNGDVEVVSFSVQPLADPEAGRTLLLVSFHDAAAPHVGKPVRRRRRAPGGGAAWRIEELERELVYTRDNLQSTIEQQQASNEELMSANEELQSTNEELQSSNEELETSKEELQSLNEELTTVNAELQANIEQLSGMQNDMKNLLDNTHVGTVFLDRHLLIRRFTPEATRIFRFVSTDVGRPLGDIKSNLKDDDLLAAAQTVLETLVPFERAMRSGAETYLVRIHPYRTLDNVVEGLVLTFTDISRRVDDGSAA